MTEPHSNFRDMSLEIKDTSSPMGLHLSYTKVNKLITALYMVTDILDTQEPLRIKLRNAGSDILSDTYQLSTQRSHAVSYRLIGQISHVLAMLEIASTVGVLSEMNCQILKSEFLLLKDSINKALLNYPNLKNEINLGEVFRAEPTENQEPKTPQKDSKIFQIKQPFMPPKRTTPSTRIGVQKGATLLQAISDTVVKQEKVLKPKTTPQPRGNFNLLRNERRDIILNIIKDKKDGATITDIRNSAYGPLKDMGEKTLQRELVAMVAQGVLEKIGEKRWSRYSLAS